MGCITSNEQLDINIDIPEPETRLHAKHDRNYSGFNSQKNCDLFVTCWYRILSQNAVLNIIPSAISELIYSYSDRNFCYKALT